MCNTELNTKTNTPFAQEQCQPTIDKQQELVNEMALYKHKEHAPQPKEYIT